MSRDIPVTHVARHHTTNVLVAAARYQNGSRYRVRFGAEPGYDGNTSAHAETENGDAHPAWTSTVAAPGHPQRRPGNGCNIGCKTSSVADVPRNQARSARRPATPHRRGRLRPLRRVDSDSGRTAGPVHGHPSPAPTTRADWESVIANQLVPALGDVPLWHLTARACDALYTTLKAEGLGPSRVRSTHVVLHRAVAQAVRWGWLALNPVSDASRPDVPRTTITLPDAPTVR
jgi:hypothetical protein